MRAMAPDDLDGNIAPSRLNLVLAGSPVIERDIRAEPLSRPAHAAFAIGWDIAPGMRRTVQNPAVAPVAAAAMTAIAMAPIAKILLQIGASVGVDEEVSFRAAPASIIAALMVVAAILRFRAGGCSGDGERRQAGCNGEMG